tara:strand:+ start:1499 stop:1918 length:420 start_codon:yes stop_codon:yes gene_type:complete
VLTLAIQPVAGGDNPSVLRTVEQIKAFIEGAELEKGLTIRMPLPADIAKNVSGFWYYPKQPVSPLITAIFVSKQNRSEISLMPAPDGPNVECLIIQNEVCIGIRSEVDGQPVLLDTQHSFLPPRSTAGALFAGYVHAVI